LSRLKKIFTSPVALLIIGSMLLRLFIYLLLPVSNDFGRYTNSGPLYFSALTAHFGDYISANTNVPPATYIIDACVLKLVGPATAINIRAFLLLISILNIIGLVLLFHTCIRMGSDRRISLFLLCLLSVTLVPFELWRDGMHYDHFTFFFTSFFAWAIVRVIKNPPNYRDPLLVSAAGALLVSQSAVSAAIVPLSVIFIFIFSYALRRKYLSLVYGLSVALLLPFSVLYLVSKKNQKEGQESLTSNKAGPAMMMVVQRAYRYDAGKVRQLAVETGAPAWYTWAYDHAMPSYDSATGKPADWLNLAQAFGICFYSDSGKGKGPWQFYFDPLIHYLEQNGPQNILPAVKADADDAISKPYRFAGFAPELSPRWIGIYGEVSQRIFYSAILKNPVGMLRSFIAQQGIFFVYGPLFPYNTTQSKATLLARSGLRTEKDNLPLQPLLVLATLLFAIIAWIIYAVMLVNIPLTIWKWINAIRRREVKKGSDVFFLLSVPAVCVAVVFSCLVGGENDRYFMQMLPYLTPLASYLPVWFNRVKKND
jgi:hypothetical protein